VKRRIRDEPLSQGVWSPETPRERTQREGLAEDVLGNPDAGRAVALRLRNFRPSADGYIASIAGPRAYMLRLRAIERMTEALEEDLRNAWRDLAEERADDARGFARRWRAKVKAWSFDEINDLIEFHNRWYPTESRLPMDPATRDFALVNGEDYRRAPLDAEWALRRFPPRLGQALDRSQRAGARLDREQGKRTEAAAEQVGDGVPDRVRQRAAD
jgi:hypothetical protein